MFGAGDEFQEDVIMGKLESTKAVIEQVNKQFSDPVTFVVPISRIEFCALCSGNPRLEPVAEPI